MLLNQAILGSSMKSYSEKLVSFLLPEMKKLEIQYLVQFMQHRVNEFQVEVDATDLQF